MSEQEVALTIDVQGMDCADCAHTLEKGVRQLDGVRTCDVSFAGARLHVVGSAPRSAVIARVRELGYDVVEAPDGAGGAATAGDSGGFLAFMWRRRNTRLALLGMLLISPGVVLGEVGGIDHPAVNIASLGALIAAGLPISISAWRAVTISREININVLMTIASVGAVFIGAYTEAGMVMVLFAIGEALEGYTTGRARDAIRSLMQVVPEEATRLHRHDDRVSETTVPVAVLRPGDVIVVRPGERIPMDGRVVAGASLVNQAPITGESRLVGKRAGADVFASSINGEGALEIEVTRLSTETTISRLVQMVEEAKEKRAPIERFVDRFARLYTPAVVVLAAAVATVPPLLLGRPFLNPGDGTFGWLYRGLALLVVACPCALVISTPVSIISAISNAAGHGVLVKGGAVIEAMSRVRAVAFDKTGTLTEGRPSVVGIRSVDCERPADDSDELCGSCQDVLALASAVERRSEHTLAQAIVDESQRRGLGSRYPTATMVRALVGQGVTGHVADREVTIGSHALFDAGIPHSAEHCSGANHDETRGHTPMMVSTSGQYVGTIAVADTVRPSSRETVAWLREAGLDAVVMLTGDHGDVAGSVGAAIGVVDVRSDLLPEHKVAAVEALQREYGPVAMVGDGINDAPALATASVGIAVGGASGSTTQAMETADITLMSDDLRQLPFVLQLSRATMRTVHANVALSIGIKAVFLAMVLAGLGTMWMAVLADMGTSLLVTLNGMRLLRRPWSPVGTGSRLGGDAAAGRSAPD